MRSYKVVYPNGKPPAPSRLPAAQFWGLCFIVYMLLQFPLVRIPIVFLSTWIHELGHGMGAILTGGSFSKLTIYPPNLSGTALTSTTNNFQRLSVLFLGLLAPSLLGVVMIFLTRGLSWYRASLILLTVLLVLSQLWAADMFTRLTLAISALIFGGMAWKIPSSWLVYITQILAIALCLDALTDFRYFFMGGGVIDGVMMQSDTASISRILGLRYWFWGAVVTLLSIIILVLGVFFSDKWARDHPRA